MVTLAYTNEDGSQLPVQFTIPIPAGIPQTVTTLAVPTVDATDPQNPVVTVAYTNEDGSQLPVQFTIPIPPAGAETVTTIAAPTVDATDPQNPVVTISYTNEDGSQLPVQFTIPIPAAPAETVTTIAVPTVDVTDPQNPVVTIAYTNEDGSQLPVQFTIPIPSGPPPEYMIAGLQSDTAVTAVQNLALTQLSSTTTSVSISGGNILFADAGTYRVSYDISGNNLAQGGQNTITYTSFSATSGVLNPSEVSIERLNSFHETFHHLHTIITVAANTTYYLVSTGSGGNGFTANQSGSKIVIEKIG